MHSSHLVRNPFVDPLSKRCMNPKHSGQPPPCLSSSADPAVPKLHTDASESTALLAAASIRKKSTRHCFPCQQTRTLRTVFLRGDMLADPRTIWQRTRLSVAGWSSPVNSPPPPLSSLHGNLAVTRQPTPAPTLLPPSYVRFSTDISIVCSADAASSKPYVPLASSADQTVEQTVSRKRAESEVNVS